MTVEVFLDTNIIVYAVDAAAPAAKRAIARGLMREGKFAVSTQVVQEFYVSKRLLTTAAKHPCEAVRER
jgi:predicted nucleic acid-binding protein